LDVGDRSKTGSRDAWRRRGRLRKEEVENVEKGEQGLEGKFDVIVCKMRTVTEEGTGWGDGGDESAGLVSE
jgi:hypothetical protein